jgi:hypothetical protein
VVIAYLLEVSIAQQLLDLPIAQSGVGFCKLAKRHQFVVSDVVAVFLGEQIFVNPELAASCQNNRAMLVVVEALLEDAAAQIISLALLYLPDGTAQIRICNASLPGRFAKPFRFEDSLDHNK